MKSSINIIHSSKNYNRKASVLTIGNFDGVHIGHQQLIHKVNEISKQRNLCSCVFTFEPSPRSTLSPKTKPSRIANWVDKINWLHQIGIENVILEPFSSAFAQHSPEWFIHEILLQRLQTEVLVVGYDFHFGRARAGTVDMIRELAPQIKIFQVPPLHINDMSNVEHKQIFKDMSPQSIISSTLIRDLIQGGDVSKAGILLSRPHKIEGVVISGMQRGRKIGFPTANIMPKTELIPSTGVYAVRVHIDSETEGYDGMANLGVQPTFNGHSFQIEVHIFDFHKNIYGSNLEVSFIKKLRSEKKFFNSSELVAQLQKDKQYSRHILQGLI
jgi:riboflavin kinase / FMN adenylyltransferase